MGLFDKVEKMTMSDLDDAMDRIADYYKHAKLFLEASNAVDAYDYIVSEFREDISAMIRFGYCYKYRGNYLIAVDLDDFEVEYPEEYQHCLGYVPQFSRYIKRENKDIMYIAFFGTDKVSMNNDSYHLINQFVNKYIKDYVLLSDCTAGIDIETTMFEKHTGCRRLNLNGNVFYRWVSKE